MWHEARKQEKFIRNVMVDVKKRAERRKDFYEKIKLDPIRFLRLYGTKSKISIDPEIAVAAENPNTLMTWMGDNKTIIDRFDGRANLDGFSVKSDAQSCDRDEKLHERMCNYERYRCLVHNQYAKISELNALNRIELAEKYGEDIQKIEKKQSKKKPAEKAAIGYVYSDSDYVHNPSESDNDSDSQDSEPDLEMDLDIEMNINHLHFLQQKELVKMSQQYGMRGNDYLKLMKLDKTQEEDLRTAKILEEQKAQFHGRKSRRERKIFKEQRLRERYMKQDPRTLTFGASSFHEEIYEGKNLLTPSPKRDSRSMSSSPSTVNNKITESSSRNLRDFLKLPKQRDASDNSRSRSRSRGNRCSTSPVIGPRLPFVSGVKASNKKSSYRDKMDNSRDKRRSV